jgi:hypothetical protein
LIASLKAEIDTLRQAMDADANLQRSLEAASGLDVADDVRSRSASDLSNVLIHRTVLSLDTVRELSKLVRGGLVSPEIWKEAYDMWLEFACVVDYDKHTDLQVGIAAERRGGGVSPEGETYADIRKWFWKQDFATFVQDAVSAPGYDKVALPFRQSFEQMKQMGLNTRQRVVLTVFHSVQNPRHLEMEELTWTVYLFAPARELQTVMSIPRDTLVSEYDRLMEVAPLPALRATIKLKAHEMQLAEIDVANRSLRSLVMMCESKGKGPFLDARRQRAAIAQDDEGS